jgi:hypothetical protein
MASTLHCRWPRQREKRLQNRTKVLPEVRRGEKERRYNTMKRHLVILTALTLLALPVMVWADDGGEALIPPEMNWTPYPPARQIVNATTLANVLREKGVLSSQEYAQLTQPQGATPTRLGQDIAQRLSTSSLTTP